MSTPDLEQLTAALATVNDPEIKRPITELGMVDSVEVDDAGLVRGHGAADRRPAARSRTPSTATSPPRSARSPASPASTSRSA